MNIYIITLIVGLLIAAALVALYFVGNRANKKQDEQRAQLDAMAETVSMLIIDKKHMKIMDAGFPKMITDQVPKRARRTLMPVVKVKIGPRITPMLCDEAIFDDIPVKAEVKAVVSGIYITSIKNTRNVAPPAPEKRKGIRAKLAKKQAEYQQQRRG